LSKKYPEIVQELTDLMKIYNRWTQHWGYSSEKW